MEVWDNMEENFRMEWSMEWKGFNMEWKKIASMEYGKIVFHSISYHALLIRTVLPGNLIKTTFTFCQQHAAFTCFSVAMRSIEIVK